MELIKMFPELQHKTIWNFMPDYAVNIIWREITLEKEFGRPLPNNSYYKMLCIKMIRQAQLKFKSQLTIAAKTV